MIDFGQKRGISKAELMEDAQSVAEICEGDMLKVAAVVERTQTKIGGVNQLDTVLYIRSVMLWAMNAFPAVEVGAKYAAALCSTEIREEVVEMIRSPWPSWLLEVPDGLLIVMVDDKPATVRRIQIAEDAGYWMWTAYCADGTSFFRWGMPTAHLGKTGEELAGTVFYPCGMGKEKYVLNHMTPENGRLLAVIGRLIAGICLAMHAPENIRKQPSGAAGAWKPRSAGAPDIRGRLYVLGHPIKLDCRESVRDYLVGNTRTISSVQGIVRGHWRNQAYGPRHSLRRPQWIQPFWRGAEDAPVMLRPHVVAGDES